MVFKKGIISLVFFVALIPSVAFAEAKPHLVTTTGMIGDVVYNIAGDFVEIKTLMGPGVDPHLYRATRSDISTLNSANIVFYNGLLLEGKMTDALMRIASSGEKVFAVTELIDSSYLLEPKEFQGHYDPHVWMDPKAWEKAAELILKRLSELFPENSAVFRENADRYFGELKNLDTYANRVISTIPKTSRILITAHDAFNYFGRRYGIEVVGIQGISTESQAGVKDIENLVNLIVTKKVKAVFVESTVSDRNIKALIEGAAAKGHQVTIGGKLFSDAMGKPGTYEGTYLGMIDHNVTLITRALGGNAPEFGYQNKLSGDQ